MAEPTAEPREMITQQQYKRLMSEYKKTEQISISAMKAGIDRHTAGKYIEAGKSPKELQVKHTWRTRPDPLAEIWDEVARMLADAPELESKTLFEHFLARPDSGLEESHLRTFFRRVRHWRATQGPEREVFFAQEQTPGQLLQLDWTYARELRVRIQGGNWTICSATVCCLTPIGSGRLAASRSRF
jgi:hypothetical protein